MGAFIFFLSSMYISLYINILRGTMKNSLSPSTPMGTTDWHGLTKREYVETEGVGAWINKYGAKSERHYKDLAFMKMSAYEYVRAALVQPRRQVLVEQLAGHMENYLLRSK
jgi:hypothetical protein